MIDSKVLCRITGALIVIAQGSALCIAIATGVPPIEHAYGIALWGVVVAMPFFKSK